MRAPMPRFDLLKLLIVLTLLLFVIGADSRRRRSCRDFGKDPEIKGMIKEWEKLERRYSQDYSPKRFRRRKGDLRAFGSGRARTRKVIANVFDDSFDAQLPPWKWASSSASYDRRRTTRKFKNKRLAKHKRRATRGGKKMTFVEESAPMAPLSTSPPKEAPRTPRFLQEFSPYTTVDKTSDRDSESGSSGWDDVDLDSSECNIDLHSSARRETPRSVVCSATWAVATSVIFIFLI